MFFALGAILIVVLPVSPARRVIAANVKAVPALRAVSPATNGAVSVVGAPSPKAFEPLTENVAACPPGKPSNSHVVPVVTQDCPLGAAVTLQMVELDPGSAGADQDTVTRPPSLRAARFVAADGFVVGMLPWADSHGKKVVSRLYKPG